MGNIPLTLYDGKLKYLIDVLHVPSITKNPVSVGKMVEQGLQVRFTPTKLFIEEFKEDNHLIAQGKKVGKMFTLNVDVPKIKATVFAQGTCVVADMKTWHTRIGHINVQRLKSMQNHNIILGIPKFKVAQCM